MQKKWWNVLNLVVLAVIVLGLIWVVVNSFVGEVVVVPNNCIDSDSVLDISYEGCYDFSSNSIFLKAVRGQDDYQISALEFYFFDVSKKYFELGEVPGVGGVEFYKISSEKNPGSVEIGLDIARGFSESVCVNVEKVVLANCPVRVDVSLNPLGEGVVGDFVDVNEMYNRDSDILDSDLVDRAAIWEARCKSDWDCDPWDSCVDGVERRDCWDLNDCPVSIDAPVSVRYCEGGCIENWECEWSSCVSGVSTPVCWDLNDCGTFYDIPRNLDCRGRDSCVPNIKCGEWSSCEVNYNFANLIEGVQNLDGVKTRICEDVSGCMASRQDLEDCSVSVDVYTERFVKCGKEYVAVYDSLDGGLVARIEEGAKGDPYLNINFDNGLTIDPYCDYCYDGVLSGDEEGVDCGGGCEDCSEKYKAVVSRGWFGRFWNWISG